MEAFLIDHWLRDTDPLPLVDVASVSLIRDRVRALGSQCNMPEQPLASLVIVASELAHNGLAHGARGAVAVRAIERAGVPGLEVVAADSGAGMEDPERAFLGVPRSSGSLGVGLAGVRSLSDEVDVDIRLGEGMCIWARKFASPVGRRREVGIFGRPHPSERVSGDQAWFMRSPESLLVTVADGLGHGREARIAADRAMAGVRQRSSLPVGDILEGCDSDLSGTRGAVMAGLRLHELTGRVDLASVGNVTTRATRFRQTRTYEGSAFVLGARGPTRKRFALETLALEPNEVILVTSDGISSRLAIDADGSLLHESPIVIAQRVLQEFGQAHDDATVLVAR
jgi:anti-sigma regulatory factor (Ser/Thr protein kinase)